MDHHKWVDHFSIEKAESAMMINVLTRVGGGFIIVFNTTSSSSSLEEEEKKKEKRKPKAWIEEHEERLGSE